MGKILFLFLLLTVATYCLGETNTAREKEDDRIFVINEEGKHGPITFVITIDGGGKIKNLAILESIEIKGSKIGRKRFLKQFIGKRSEDPIRVNKDIDAVTGATVSSKAAARAARKALIMWEESPVKRE